MDLQWSPSNLHIHPHQSAYVLHLLGTLFPLNFLVLFFQLFLLWTCHLQYLMPMFRWLFLLKIQAQLVKFHQLLEQESNQVTFFTYISLIIYGLVLQLNTLVLMVWLCFLHYISLCISCDKNLEEFLMLCSVL